MRISELIEQSFRNDPNSHFGGSEHLFRRESNTAGLSALDTVGVLTMSLFMGGKDAKKRGVYAQCKRGAEAAAR